jgi:dihydroxy-acid dehydratase
MKKEGLPDDMFDGRPVIGICNTWSELTPCNTVLRTLADHVKNGVLEAGGMPLEFPVMSLGETLMRPTTMMFRNLAAMDTEEAIRANPLDGVVLLAGCDKTTPALLMGAASCDLPAILLSTGPMLNGRFRDMTIGSGTHYYKFEQMLRAGEITKADYSEVEACMSRSEGTCMTMGTASTMACLSEALGVTLPGNGAIPAADSRRLRLARESGRRIVELVKQDVKLSQILTREAFENAIRVCAALGGSTNAIIHLLALAGRAGVPLKLKDWDDLCQGVPCLVNLMPSGDYLMEDFYGAGGMPVVMKHLGSLLHGGAITANGRTVAENAAAGRCWNPEVIHTLDKPFKDAGGVAVLYGNLAPTGAVIKPSAATPSLLKHTGPAVVFDSVEHLDARLEREDLAITENSVMVLRNCGPCGYPGMPEIGNMPLPRKLLTRGVRDVVRVSDARMSGTAYGAVVLHVTPEAAVGGPLALVRDGDEVSLDVSARSLELRVEDQELARRKAEWRAPALEGAGGYQTLYTKHVMQADQGADFDFLVGCRGAGVPRPCH